MIICHFKVRPYHISTLCLFYLFQGHNSSIAGMERSFTLEPVKNWYTVMFDIAFWVVLHLFVHGAFRDIQVNFFFRFPLANHPNAW